MDAENFVVDDGGKGQVVEDFGAVAPDVDRAVFAEALVVESVDLSDLTRLVIASDQGDTLRVTNFQGEQKKERLDRIVATIDEIAHEQVVGIGAFAAHLE